ncbi:PEGA domain-containing protein [Candidatus Saccharibacteria bacterium]|nr:PEGA domain-containing protein [Candidatus Saccharibacteria bacterium]
MDRKRVKKIRNARVIMTNIFMGLSVVAIVFVLMLFAMGFSFNENGSLEQSGLLQISSHPSGAVVEIDGKTQFGHTTINKMLSSGEHHIRVTKSGYDTWEKDVRIDAGLLTNINWVRLFPAKNIAEDVATYDAPRLVSFSYDRKSLLYGENESTDLLLLNLQDDHPTPQKIDIATLLNISSKETARTADLSIVSWNESGNKTILTWKDEENIYWYLADLEKPENSVNLTAKFGYTFSKILMANDSASKLWAVENGNLHLIDLGNLTINKTKISGIESLSSNRDTIIYVGTDVTTKTRAIYLFREGETGATMIHDLTGINAKNITLSAGVYWGNDWIAYSIDNTIYLYGGHFPSFDKPVKNSLKSILKRELSYTPTRLIRDSELHIVVFSDGTNRTAFDFETKDYFDSHTEAPVTAQWLDDYILWYNHSNKIFIQDFDGSNHREIIPEINNSFPICLSENNRWLYYFVTTAITPEQTEESEEATSVEVDKIEYSYELKRRKLNI